MKTSMRAMLVAPVLIAVLGVAPARAGERWVRYEARDYGFSMLVPAGTRLVEREQYGGWGELWAEHEGIKLFAMIKLGDKASRAEIEQVGVHITGIPGDDWTTIGKGANVAGFIWYRTVEAVRKGRLFLGDYGTGQMGSYLLVLQTTPSDFERYKADYKTWYQSIRLH